MFALLLSGLMALVALSVDLGLLRVIQASMQNAVDAGAVEAVWQRDVEYWDPTGVDADARRRQLARDRLRRVFDEDYDLATENTEIRLGAGSVVTTGVVSTADPAGGLLQVGSVYAPGGAGDLFEFQLNLENLAHGDLVAGSFDDAALPPGTTYREAADYTRADFTPATPGTGAAAEAFLVRMRRSHDPLGLDNVPGVSSSGPSQPLLFSAGTFVRAEEGAAYDPRRDGLTVRATAIAEARPALAAGFQGPDSTLDGVPDWRGVFVHRGATGTVGLALSVSGWTALAAGPQALDVDGTGQITLGGSPVGRFFAVAPGDAASVGGIVPGPVAPSGSEVLLSPIPAFAVIFSDDGGLPPGTIVGFGPVYASYEPLDLTALALERSPVSRVAPGNASAVDPAARASLALSAPLRAAHAAFLAEPHLEAAAFVR